MPVDAKLEDARILILFPHMVNPGGALTYTLRLAEQLLIRGAEVAILTLKVNNGKFELPAGLRVINLNGPVTSSLRYWLLYPFWQKKIDHAVNDWAPAVIVPQVFPSNWWGWLYKRKNTHAKLVWICHEPSAFIHSPAWISSLRPWWKCLLARILSPFLSKTDLSLAQHCDRIVANSSFTSTEVERVYGVVADGIASPGIDFQAFTGRGLKRRAIVTVARLTKFKRVDFLLEVFRQVLNDHPALTYHIVGEGEEEAELRELARQLDIESRVVFHGSVTDSALMEIYEGSTLFLHGSVGEPFGMAPLEAIASGTPVVANRSGGPMEFVNERCGRLLDSLEVEVWAREVSSYLETLASDDCCHQQVRECARAFDWSLSLRPATEVIADICAESAATCMQQVTPIQDVK